MLTAIEHGSVGPKRMAKAISESKAVLNQYFNFVCLYIAKDPVRYTGSLKLCGGPEKGGNACKLSEGT